MKKMKFKKYKRSLCKVENSIVLNNKTIGFCFKDTLLLKDSEYIGAKENRIIRYIAKSLNLQNVSFIDNLRDDFFVSFLKDCKKNRCLYPVY